MFGKVFSILTGLKLGILFLFGLPFSRVDFGIIGKYSIFQAITYCNRKWYTLKLSWKFHLFAWYFIKTCRAFLVSIFLRRFWTSTGLVGLKLKDIGLGVFYVVIAFLTCFTLGWSWYVRMTLSITEKSS